MLILRRMLPIKDTKLTHLYLVGFDRCVEGIAADYWKIDLFSTMASARVLLFLLSAATLLTWVRRISGADSTSILDMLAGKSRLSVPELTVNYVSRLHVIDFMC